MYVSMDWLSEYVKLAVPLEEYAERMNMVGAKVEGIERKDQMLGGRIVNARIVKKEKHPNADKLSVCTMDVGADKTVSVLTAATNINEGDIVPLALPGAQLVGKHIEATEMRGIMSEGMLCSGEELGLEDKVLPKYAEGGIYIFSEEVPLGEDSICHLGLDDTVIDFEITNNRQDCNSMIGMAREAGAAFDTKVFVPEVDFKETRDEIGKYLKVTVADEDLCFRYCARVMKVKKIASSPLWMQRRLMASGFRPINNVVDVTNYVLLEIGQPLHAFDYQMIGGREIIVRRAEKDETITTLDGRERNACADLLLIADEHKGVGIAGIMGGQNSEITEETRMIVIESAAFNPANIRASLAAMHMETDAGLLFAKGVNAALSAYAADRAAQLLVEIGAAELVEGIIDIYPNPRVAPTVVFDAEWVNAFISMDVPVETMKTILSNLGVSYTEKNGVFEAVGPPWRLDLKIKEDYAEEIARIYGYEKIPATLNDASTYVSLPNDFFDFKLDIKQLFASLGGYETLTYTFTSAAMALKMNLGLKEEEMLRLINPLGENTAYMRVTLAGSLLEVVGMNLARKNEKGFFFELGSVFLKEKTEEGLPYQPEKLAAVMYGGHDFFDLKGCAEALFERIGITAEFVRGAYPATHSGKSADIYASGRYLGYLGVVHPKVASAFGIGEDTVMMELDVAALYALSDRDFVYKPIAKFPALLRDIAIVVKSDILNGEILACIRKSGGGLLDEVALFDVYEGKQVGRGLKSLAYSLAFRAEDRTLTDEEAEALLAKILSALEEEFDAKLR